MVLSILIFCIISYLSILISLASLKHYINNYISFPVPLNLNKVNPKFRIIFSYKNELYRNLSVGDFKKIVNNYDGMKDTVKAQRKTLKDLSHSKLLQQNMKLSSELKGIRDVMR